MTKVTRDDLRKMKMGETRQFELPNAQTIESGKATAYQMGILLGCKFRMSADYTNNTLTITRIPK